MKRPESATHTGRGSGAQAGEVEARGGAMVQSFPSLRPYRPLWPRDASKSRIRQAQGDCGIDVGCVCRRLMERGEVDDVLRVKTLAGQADFYPDGWLEDGEDTSDVRGTDVHAVETVLNEYSDQRHLDQPALARALPCTPTWATSNRTIITGKESNNSEREPPRYPGKLGTLAYQGGGRYSARATLMNRSGASAAELYVQLPIEASVFYAPCPWTSRLPKKQNDVNKKRGKKSRADPQPMDQGKLRTTQPFEVDILLPEHLEQIRITEQKLSTLLVQNGDKWFHTFCNRCQDKKLPHDEGSSVPEVVPKTAAAIVRTRVRRPRYRPEDSAELSSSFHTKATSVYDVATVGLGGFEGLGTLGALQTDFAHSSPAGSSSSYGLGSGLIWPGPQAGPSQYSEVSTNLQTGALVPNWADTSAALSDRQLRLPEWNGASDDIDWTTLVIPTEPNAFSALQVDGLFGDLPPALEGAKLGWSRELNTDLTDNPEEILLPKA
ncbi:hypothetical protein DFP72DRAFT_857662 [Ephemerocybe angulata]|uniref:Uncharacterized protein n=1 Tax=Ephemerocybe angulata TaxID=980116 RepID=A0A8H6HEL4_9AGAR|nr:hypothetical protein DFP72DRAFT_857662 [Tulosesus angulatus]